MPDLMDAQEGDEHSIEVGDVHVCVGNTIQHSKFSKTEKPIMLVKNDSLGSEKHISVDPFSLRESSTSQSEMFTVATPARKFDAFHIPALHPPTKPKFLSYSLPNSASSSPRFSSMMLRKKPGNLNQVSPLPINPFFRQNSIALANLERLRENHLRRSKSCGEGRTSAPPEELDLWMVKSSMKRDHQRHNKVDFDSCKAEVKEQQNRRIADEITMDSYDGKVKCGALCLFLPGFGKTAKPVKARKEVPQEIVHFREPENLGLVVSKRFSLEKFKCGSWRSSVILDDNSNLFFDLPLEMIRCSASDTHLPVTTAFVFDKDRKGVLRKSSAKLKSTSKKSSDSSRHVRFSTSSPTSYPATPTSSCIAADDPLHRAREDLNSFLAAQSSA